MSLDKFTMETVDDSILDAIEAVRGRHHKRTEKLHLQLLKCLYKIRKIVY